MSIPMIAVVEAMDITIDGFCFLDDCCSGLLLFVLISRIVRDLVVIHAAPKVLLMTFLT